MSEGSINNRLSTDLSTQIRGAGRANAVNGVSGNSAPVKQEKGPQISGNGTAAVSSGTPQVEIGRLFAQGNITSPNNFYTGKSSNITGHPTIDAQMEVLLPEHPNSKTPAAYQALEALANSASTSDSPAVVRFNGANAVLPLNGANAKFGELVRYASSRLGGSPTTADSIKLFHESSD
jgi:hypothetical protein